MAEGVNRTHSSVAHGFADETRSDVDVALKMLLHDRLRFAVTLAGLAFAVILALFTAGLLSGLLDRSTSVIAMLRADLWVSARGVGVVDFPIDFAEVRVDAVRAIPGVMRADDLLVRVGQVKSADGSVEPITIYAMKDFTRWHLHLVEGRVRDLHEVRGVALDGSPTARRRMGEFHVGDYREINGHRLKILGETLGPSTFTTSPLAFMDYTLFQTLMPGAAGQTSYIVVKLAPGADRAAVANEIRRRLPMNEVFTAAQWSRRTRHYWLYRTGLGLNMGIDVMMAFVVGIIIVAQSVYTSTTEHLNEFGTIKAIGGSNWDIYRLLLRHAFIYALGGFAIGCFGVLVLNPILMRADDMGIVVSPQLALATLATCIAMAAAAAMLSFRKVSAIDPAMVFRQ